MTPVLLVLGAGPGVGYAVASRFRREDHRVVLLARNAERLEALAERLRAEPLGPGGASLTGGSSGLVGAAEVGGALGAADKASEYGDVDTVAVDLTDPAAVRDAVARVGAEQGRIDVLHFNPSAFRMKDPLHLSVEELFADLALGVAPLLPAVQAARPYFADGARVLVTGSAAADKPWHEAASLGVQKAAVRNLVASLDATLTAADGVDQQVVHAADGADRRVVHAADGADQRVVHAADGADADGAVTADGSGRRGGRRVRAVAVQVNGILAEDGPFSPGNVAEALYQAAIRPDADWTPHVTHP